MLSISKVQGVKVKRTFIKGKKGVDSFYVITLEVSHGSTALGNDWLEKFQISFMSEKELPILEGDDLTVPTKKYLEMCLKLKEAKDKLENENEEAGMRTLTEPEAWEGGFAKNA